MNTKFKMNRQAVLTIGVLLTAMWLPLTTFAQDVSQTGDQNQGRNTWVENREHCQTKNHSHDALTFSPGSGHWASEETVGFSETDPTVQQSEDVVAAPQASHNLVRQVSVGFAEADPASNQFQQSVTVLAAYDSPAQQAPVGFSETDPAVYLIRSVAQTRSQHFANYHCANAMGTTLSALESHPLTEMGSRHEHG